MKILNFGSINIDHVYMVDHFARPGETLSSKSYQRFSGGKGLNQSIALSHAGANVCHAGKIGVDGCWLKNQLEKHGVDTTFVEQTNNPTGHAIIQVNPAGENSIVIYGGANQCIMESDVARIVNEFSHDDYLLVQNEVSLVPHILGTAKQKGLTIVFNPSPMTLQVLTYPLELVDIFIVNEIEAQGLTNETDPERIRAAMREKYPDAGTALTCGEKGAMYFDSEVSFCRPAEKVIPVDTTAAGDTFTGFFLAELMRTGDAEKALALGCQAAALCVMRQGAGDSIPRKEELKHCHPIG